MGRQMHGEASRHGLGGLSLTVNCRFYQAARGISLCNPSAGLAGGQRVSMGTSSSWKKTLPARGRKGGFDQVISGKKKKAFFSWLPPGMQELPCLQQTWHSSKIQFAPSSRCWRGVGWKPSVLLRSACLGTAGVIFLVLFHISSKTFRNVLQGKSSSCSFFFLACLLQFVHVPFQLTAQTFLHLKPAQSKLPRQDHRHHQPVCRWRLRPTPPHTHMFWSPTQLLSCK